MSHTSLSPEATERLFDEVEKRTAALESARHEIEILYDATNKLVQATTPDELLEAVSAYPREIGAVCGTLGYFEDWQPQWLEAVAAWATEPVHLVRVGARVDATKQAMPSYAINNPHKPLLIEDIFTSEFADEANRDAARRYQTCATAVLPLYLNQSHIGVLIFRWKDTYQFTERDERILTALHQQLATIVAFKHLLEETQTRAKEIESTRYEMTVLYEASNDLVRASTPDELLKAVSAYPREIGAVNATLGYFDNWQPQWLEVMGVWATAPIHSATVGTRVDLSQRSLPMKSISSPERPLFVEDLFAADFVGEESLQLARQRNLRSMALLPLHFNGRWVGTLTFSWTEVHQFDERDERIFTALHQQLSAVAAFKRLLQEAQSRATELEVARHEMNILYEASSQLVQASTPEAILEAVSAYARENGATSATLGYYDDFQPYWIEMVASWGTRKKYVRPVGYRIDVENSRFQQHSKKTPDKPTFVTDVLESEFASQVTRDYAKTYHVRAVVDMSLYNNGRWIGLITFTWDKLVEFDERDKRIYAAIQQQLAPVVDSLRLLDQSRKRTIDLELINQELNLLYKASEVINSADTYQEVVEAVAQFDTEADVVTLMLWDTWDWKTAEYLDVLVVIDRVNNGKLPVGTRLRKEDFPIAKAMVGNRVWLIEDGETDPRVDLLTRITWKALDIRSFMGPALYINKQWIGGITFHSSKPRQYSEREERLLAGIGDLVLAAIKRIRLQNETEASRQHAELLANTNADLLRQAQQRATELEAANAEIDLMYRIGEGINAANTYEELVNAVSGIIEGATAVALFFWENRNFKTATYVEQVAATGYLVPYIGHRVSKETLAYTQDNQDRLIVFEDVAEDTRLDSETISNYLARQLQAAISIRLYVKKRWIGALVFNSDTPHAFSERDKRLAAGVGDYVVGAVERIRLREETEAARLEAERHAQQAQKLASLEERTRLARELHDSVSQVLYGIGLGARTARAVAKQSPEKLSEPLDYILSLAEAGLTEMRALIFELRPESLEQEGLITTLKKQAASLQTRYGIQVDTFLCDEPDLSFDVKESLYRIAREAMHNTVKHAHATSVRVSMNKTDDTYRLTIADDGLGFDVNQTFTGHLGLKSMRERTASLGGHLEVITAPGEGTTITVTIHAVSP